MPGEVRRRRRAHAAALWARLPLRLPAALAAVPRRLPLLPGHRASSLLTAGRKDGWMESVELDDDGFINRVSAAHLLL